MIRNPSPSSTPRAAGVRGLLPIVLVLVGCVTINVYFPEAEVKDLSEEIENLVRERAHDLDEEGNVTPPSVSAHAPPIPSRAGAPVRAQVHVAAQLDARTQLEGAPHRAPWISRLLGVATAHAQDVPPPQVSNPAIRRIIEARARRIEAIAGFKAQQAIGENNQALLEIRDLQAVSDLRQRAELQRLVREENADREQLYREIAAALGVDSSQLGQVRATYAETLREYAKRGELIQMPDGSWRSK